MQVTSANYGENDLVRPKSGLLASVTPLPENAPKVHHNRYYELKDEYTGNIFEYFLYVIPPTTPPPKRS